MNSGWMGIGAGYCEGNLNFATASEDDEVYTKKKVSRVSFNNRPSHKLYTYETVHSRRSRAENRKATERDASLEEPVFRPA
ncbi:hypothetical protein K0M31_003364 [Melipona bicolor]|uniref:Uncharacterized protein n=1 Tax=Melipona bicolor TaxID=60889 RepID=A0AA40KPH7_9HYME|nr:hypothetical protein K0M31_003364 [Melipona bicolor]